MYRISHVDELFLLQTAPTAHGRRGHGYAVGGQLTTSVSIRHLYRFLGRKRVFDEKRG